jgi:hypothetical protein
MDSRGDKTPELDVKTTLLPLKSRLNKEITYHENAAIDEEDIGHVSDVYELDIGKKKHVVVLGKPKYIFSVKHLIFIPIYVIDDMETIRSQIGVFEFKLGVLPRIGMDVSQFPEPLFYSFVNDEYLAKTHSESSLFLRKIKIPKTTTIKKTNDVLSNVLSNNDVLSLGKQENDGTEEEEESKKAVTFDDRFQVHSNGNASDGNVSDGIASDGIRTNKVSAEEIFEKIDNYSAMPALEEDTQATSAQIRKMYRPSSHDSWMAEYMKNPYYSVADATVSSFANESLFVSLCDAFRQIGKKTDVAKLRTLIATHYSLEEFKEPQKLYMEFDDRIKEMERTSARLQANVAASRVRMEATDTMEKQQEIIEKEIERTKTQRDKYVGYVREMDSVDKMREFIRSNPAYWPNMWALQTLEKALHVKFILFSEDEFRVKNMDDVLQCGQEDTSSKTPPKPEYYILLSTKDVKSTGTEQYKLISYRDHSILRFAEIPHDVKVFLVNKCIERNAGSFYRIEDFRVLKSKFGVDEDEGGSEDYAELEGANELFDPTTVFVFQTNSRKAPGKASGESILLSNIPQYGPLTEIKHWRRHLSDEWMESPFFLDGKKWKSVDHFLLGTRYRKGYPDVYHLFSLDSDEKFDKSIGDLARDLAAARKFEGHVPNKKGTAMVRVVADLDFDQQKERVRALHAKFGDNMDMRQTLSFTRNALLLYRNKSHRPLVPDMDLMKVRRELMLTTASSS